MGQGVAEVLTFAVGVAVSPLPIIALILILFSRQAHVNGRAFLAGWIVGLAVVSGVVYAIAAGADANSDTTASDSVSWLKIVLGIVLVWLAARRWRTRPAPGAAPERPKWMARVESLTPGQAAGLGALLVVANPKNLILTVGAAMGLAQLGLSTSDVVVALIVFIVVASAQAWPRRSSIIGAGAPGPRPRSTMSRPGWARTTRPSWPCCSWYFAST